MRKIDELSDEQSCLGKAYDDEMLFVLLARDVAAPDTIRFWCAKRVALGLNKDGDPQIAEALQCAEQMEIDRAATDACKDVVKDQQWAQIFKELEKDILDRRGLKSEWNQIDKQVRHREISPAWRAIIERNLSSPKKPDLQ